MSGEPDGMDIDRLRERVKELEFEREYHLGILEQAGAILFTTDGLGRVTSFNSQAEKVLGYSPENVVGKPADQFFVLDDAYSSLMERLQRVEQGVLHADVEVLTQAGGHKWLDTSFSWLRDSSGGLRGTVAVCKDVTERRMLEHQLRKLSVTDRLTGLYNQSHFYSCLEIEKERAIRLGHEMALVLFDLDGFKSVNDNQGHLAGDTMLRQVGRVLIDNIRKEVDSAFRYGGDEFTILLPGTGADTARHFCERLRLAIENMDQVVTASIGICPLVKGNPGLQMVEQADAAMYVAKRAGGNQIAIYDPVRRKPTPLAEFLQ